MNHTWVTKNLCEFEYSWYPFDVQNCFIHKEMNDELFIKTRAKHVLYSGNHDLGEIQFRELKFCDVNKFGRM